MGCMNGRMGTHPGWMDGWQDGLMDGLMDGWTANAYLRQATACMKKPQASDSMREEVKQQADTMLQGSCFCVTIHALVA